MTRRKGTTAVNTTHVPETATQEPAAIDNNFTFTKSKGCTFFKDKSEELFNLILELSGDMLEDENENSVEYSVEKLYFIYAELEQELQNHPTIAQSITALLTTIKSNYANAFNFTEKINTEKELTFNQLLNMLQNTKYISIKCEGETMRGGMLASCKKETAEGQIYLVITYSTIQYNGSFVKQQEQGVIPNYRGTMNIEDIQYLPLSPVEINMLNKRGKIYHKYATDDTFYYKQYTGVMLERYWWFYRKTDITGRVIIDMKTHKQLHPNEYANDYYTQNKLGALSFFEYCMLPSTIPAFSFEKKKWGKLIIENISDIVFNDNAYDLLVLDPVKKQILKTLVMNSKHGFTDIIQNKSGGCIFLLHGTPGTGKTLTAETISETLHVPLYSVTSGELGENVITIEQKLSEILNICQRWNAILLLDEADVFLEKRDTQNLKRNSIVCIFLRLLEKYNGIMFLTTNRRTEIDHAFQSRISLILEYADLSQVERFKVWTNLLGSANITIDLQDINKYSSFVLNGRNIKNIIRLANTLAIGENIPTENKHFQMVFDLYQNEYKMTTDKVAVAAFAAQCERYGQSMPQTNILENSILKL